MENKWMEKELLNGGALDVRKIGRPLHDENGNEFGQFYIDNDKKRRFKLDSFLGGALCKV